MIDKITPELVEDAKDLLERVEKTISLSSIVLIISLRPFFDNLMES
jgi:hypothetical protein